MTKADWIRKLTSRKLWLAVAEFVSMLMVFFGADENTTVQVASLIMAGAGALAYIIAEGLTDAAKATVPVGELAVEESVYEEDK